MKLVIYKIQLIISRIRMLVLKATHTNSQVSFNKFSDISSKTDIEIGAKAVFLLVEG